MKSVLKVIVRFIILFLAIILFYWLSIAFPQMFFQKTETENLYVYHHGKSVVKEVSLKALAKIKKSSLYNPQSIYRVFLTDSTVEYAYFTSLWRSSGGVFLVFANGNIFIRPALVEEDRLISPTGAVLASDRPLNYFIAHEATHAMEFDRLGFFKYNDLNEWVREGIADKIARDEFDFNQMLVNYRNNLPIMDRGKSGLYLKYQLLIEFMFRYKNATVESLLEENSSETEIENELIKITQ